MSLRLRIGLVLTLVLVLLGGTFASEYFYQADTLEITDVRLNKNFNMKPISVFIASEEMVAKPPGLMIANGKSEVAYIPSDFLSALNIQVNSDHENGRVELRKGSKSVIFDVSKNTYVSSGKRKILKAGEVPRLLAYDGEQKVMVPVVLVAREFSLNTSYNALQRTLKLNLQEQKVNSVYYRQYNRFREIRFKTTGEVKWSHYYLDGSKFKKKDKVFLELYNVKNAIASNQFASNGAMAVSTAGNPFITDARVTQKPSDGTMKLEITLSSQKGYHTFYDEKKKEVVLQFFNNIKGIRSENLYGSDAVVIDTGEAPIYNVKYLKGKVIIDVIDAYMTYEGGVDNTLNVDKGGVGSIAYTQFQSSGEYSPEDIVSRIVVGLKDNINSDDVYIEDVDNRIYVFVKGSPMGSYNYAKSDTYKASFTMDFEKNAKIGYTYDSSTRLFSMTVPKTAVTMQTSDLNVSDNVVDQITVNSALKDQYVVSLRLPAGTNYKVKSTTLTSHIDVAFENTALTATSNTGATLVVLDPGHGGRDSGAVGSYPMSYEKFITLQTAQKLKSKLESKGIRVFMTRETDEYVSLANRVGMANEIGATAFISIHANAFTSPAIKGVEVLYAPDQKRDNVSLARLVRGQLISLLGAADRGVIQRPNLVVLRDTMMPAVLTELGYISNPDEERLLHDDSYINKAAESIKNGLLQYLGIK